MVINKYSVIYEKRLSVQDRITVANQSGTRNINQR